MTEPEVSKKDKKSRVKDLFKCPICLETLNEPVTLMCQHTFCRACLTDLKEKRCPTCRTRAWIPPNKTVNVTMKEAIISLFGQTEYNTLYNERAHELMKSDMKSQVEQELREELWRTVANDLPATTQSYMITTGGDFDLDDDDDSDDEDGEGSSEEEFQLGFKFNELDHTTYLVIIGVLLAIIVSVVL